MCLVYKSGDLPAQVGVTVCFVTRQNPPTLLSQYWFEFYGVQLFSQSKWEKQIKSFVERPCRCGVSPDIGGSVVPLWDSTYTDSQREKSTRVNHNCFLCSKFVQQTLYWYSCRWTPLMWKGIHVWNIAMKIENQQKHSNTNDTDYIMDGMRRFHSPTLPWTSAK